MKVLRSPILLALVFGLLLGLASGALIYLLAAAPRGTPVQLQPAPTPAPLQVDISGAVKQPGVYSLPPSARVQDAVQAAGGLSDTANREAVNLAALVKDGEKLAIPAVGTPSAPLAANPAAPGSRSSTNLNGTEAAVPANTVEQTIGPVNLNTASLEQLQTLPGIGPVKAADILNYREANGGFKSIEEIMEIKGIGTATFEKLKDKITVE